MSTRALAWTAVALAILLAGVTLLALDRLGYLRPVEIPTFVFQNRSLDTERGQRVILRPIQEGATSLRYTFTGTVVEPDPDNSFFPAPYAVAGLEDRKPKEDTWYFKDNYYLVLGQLGALTPREWLEEVGLVREHTRGGGTRTMLRARYTHENGATIFYLYDPEKPTPVFGWVRNEMHAQERDPEVYFAQDGGKIHIKPLREGDGEK